MKKIIVNDANILIDIVDLNLLPHFFDLEMEFLTTSFVLDELFAEQQDALSPYIDKEILFVKEMEVEDLRRIKQLQRSKPNLSEQDCSALYQAQKSNATLLTSDNSLRKFAKTKKIDVHGHLWIFDHMVAAGTISKQGATDKLNELCLSVNPKLGLPEHECKDRFTRWKT